MPHDVTQAEEAYRTARDLADRLAIGVARGDAEPGLRARADAAAIELRSMIARSRPAPAVRTTRSHST